MREQSRESAVAVAEVEVVEIGRRECRIVARGAPNLDQFVGTLNPRQGVEQNHFDPGEDSRVRPDAQSQRHDDRERKAGPFQEHSDAVSQILPDGFHRYELGQ